MAYSAFQDIRSLKPGDHLCCIYRTEEEHKQVVSLFVRLGLEKNQKVIYIVDAHTAETVTGYLREEGVDLDNYMETGRFVILTGDETYTKDGKFDPDAMIALLKEETNKALDQGFSAFRVTGEMTWALKDLPGTERLIEYENKLNRFIPAHRCIGLCQYDKRRFSPSVLLDVLRTHPHAIIGTEVYDNFYYLPPNKLLGDKPEESELELWINNLKKYSEAQQELQYSERRYKNLYNSIRDAILVADTDGKIIDCNQAFTEQFGYTLSELEGKKTSIVYEDEDEFKNLGDKIRRTDNSAFLFTVYYQKKNGEVFPGETKVFSLKDGNEQLTGYIGLIRDITEKQKAEDALYREERFVEAILETSGALIVIIDKDGGIMRMNKTCELVSGYTEEELSRISLFDLVPEEEKEDVGKVFKELLHGMYPNTHENHWITKYGEKKFIAWTNTVVPDQKGGVENIISTGIDITEQKNEMESRVKQLEAEIMRMETYSSPGPTNVTGRMYSQKMIRETKPDDFNEMIESYKAVLNDRLEERMYRTDKKISSRLQTLAQRLGVMEAGPKDVVELHVTALKNLSSGVNYKRAKALTDEGRLLAMELMGHLVSFYRNQSSFETGYSRDGL